MKVLHFCMSRGWGGLEMASYQWARLFQEHGHVSYSICAPGSPLAQKLKSADLPWIEMDFREYFSPIQSYKLRQFVKSHDIEAVFLQSLRDLWVVSPALIGLPTKLVGFAQMWLEGINKKDFLHTLIHRRMDQLVALTPRQGAQVLKCIPFSADKTAILPNSIAVDRFNPALRSEPLRRQMGAGPSDVLIGIVGRLDPQKGQLEAIEAFSRARLLAPEVSLKMAVIGDPTADAGDDYLQQLKSTVDTLNLKEHVVFLGFRTDVPAIMASLDVFILNSYSEAFGFVLVEAMMSGTAAVATKAGGVPDVVGDGAYGRLVEPKNTESLAQTLADLARHNEDRKSLGQKAREFTLREYDENKTFQKMMTLLESLPTRTL